MAVQYLLKKRKCVSTGRGAIGVYGIELDENNDEVIGMVCVSKESITKQILVVSEKGLGKRTPFLELLDETATEEDKAKAITLKDADGSRPIVSIGLPYYQPWW